MLKGQLYSLETLTHENTKIVATITLNASHDIFKGHFPDIPVLPGVTMMQMVKEILETALNRSLLIQAAGQLKFLQMVNPLMVKQLEWEIDYTTMDEKIQVKAQMKAGETTFFKMTGTLS